MPSFKSYFRKIMRENGVHPKDICQNVMAPSPRKTQYCLGVDIIKRFIDN